MRRATKFIVELGSRHSVFEGNSELMCKALSAADFSLSTIGHTVKDSMSIASLLQTHSFFHTRKQGNFVAHALARRVRLSSPLLV